MGLEFSGMGRLSQSMPNVLVTPGKEPEAWVMTKEAYSISCMLQTAWQWPTY